LRQHATLCFLGKEPFENWALLQKRRVSSLAQKRRVIYKREVSFTKETCHLHKRRVIYKRDVSFTKETCHLQKRRVIYKRDVSSTKEKRLLQKRRVIYKRDVSFLFYKREVSMIEPTHCYHPMWRGGGLGSSTIFKKFNEPYAPS